MEKRSLENALYRSRLPQDSVHYHCVENRFDNFERMYEKQFDRAKRTEVHEADNLSHQMDVLAVRNVLEVLKESEREEE